MTSQYEFLTKIPLFAGLPEADLERLCEMVSEIDAPAGTQLFAEGSPGDRAYVIKQGQLEIIKSSGGREVLLAVRTVGEVIGEMSLLESAPRFATVRARSDSRLVVIDHAHLQRLLDSSPSAAKAMLYTNTARLRSTEQVLKQSEKMAQLGTLTAGIAHELNNPAAAVGRGAPQLSGALARLQQANWGLGRLNLSSQQLQALADMDEQVRQRAARPAALSPLERSDRQEALEGWLKAIGIEDGWELAPGLVGLDYSREQLEPLAAQFSPGQLPVLVRWLEAAASIYSLLEEIAQGATRMSEIIKALKSYVYLDQAPLQLVDLNEGLDNTLVMLRSKLKEGINVRRAYDPRLPRINAYGSELNQVWTNLIDNAIDAMDGKGELLLRTQGRGEWVQVDVTDNGPGIPPEIQPKLFSPFFTTKPVGKGAGLGLNISYNIVTKHGGDIRVSSQPGKTTFQVSLPVDFSRAERGAEPLAGLARPPDEQLLNILNSTRTIAVVGYSERPDTPAHTVPQYLQRAGYHILPVNPNIPERYPDLLSIPEAVDVALVFRRSEHVPEIAEQAIRKGAKVLWMQEGIVNQTAADRAQQAGLQVVMDTCMRMTHRRLIGK
jgi:signal transduction histidine kinase/predicted CoA-binding protein